MPEVKNLITDFDLVEYGFDKEQIYTRVFFASGTDLPGSVRAYLDRIRRDKIPCQNCGLASVCQFVSISPFRRDEEGLSDGDSSSPETPGRYTQGSFISGRGVRTLPGSSGRYFSPSSDEVGLPLQAYGNNFNSLPFVRRNPYADFFDTLPKFTQLNLFQDESS